MKVFASLSEKLGIRETMCQFSEGMTVHDVWNTVTRNMEVPRNMLVSVNQEYGKLDALLADGDEIGFFPPVTGG